ncbi:MAG: nucleotidyl transferase AbiEii/AbiGii toxin family protein [Myxococcota bacterium]|jgi:hypothetical protein|nr:nucleotidyl transferase AbiEii/AbiGii toxin family protein [Myxococcota bacterium]
MSRLETALDHAVRALVDAGARFALVGGIAISARAEPRFTRDLDLAVAVRDDAEAETLLSSLSTAGYRIVSTVEQDATGRLATARLAPPGEPDDGIVVDLLFASSGIEPEIVASAEPLVVFAGPPLPVATLPHLIALKVLSLDDRTRPQDRVDVAALVDRATGADLEAAREALASIAARGFARQQDLHAKFDALLTTHERA